MIVKDVHHLPAAPGSAGTQRSPARGTAVTFRGPGGGGVTRAHPTHTPHKAPQRSSRQAGSEGAGVPVPQPSALPSARRGAPPVVPFQASPRDRNGLGGAGLTSGAALRQVRRGGGSHVSRARR